MKDNIKQISLGIRHRREFRIPEIAGEMVDRFLNDRESPFDREIFFPTEPLVENLENKGKKLFGKEGNSVVVDYDSVILNLNSENIEDGLKKIEDTYIPYFKKVFKEYEK